MIRAFDEIKKDMVGLCTWPTAEELEFLSERELKILCITSRAEKLSSADSIHLEYRNRYSKNIDCEFTALFSL